MGMLSRPASLRKPCTLRDRGYRHFELGDVERYMNVNDATRPLGSTHGTRSRGGHKRDHLDADAAGHLSPRRHRLRRPSAQNVSDPARRSPPSPWPGRVGVRVPPVRVGRCRPRSSAAAGDGVDGGATASDARPHRRGPASPPGAAPRSLRAACGPRGGAAKRRSAPLSAGGRRGRWPRSRAVPSAAHRRPRRLRAASGRRSDRGLGGRRAQSTAWGSSQGAPMARAGSRRPVRPAAPARMGLGSARDARVENAVGVRARPETTYPFRRRCIRDPGGRNARNTSSMPALPARQPRGASPPIWAGCFGTGPYGAARQKPL